MLKQTSFRNIFQTFTEYYGCNIKVCVQTIQSIQSIHSPTLILRELSVLCRPSESERCGESVALEYEVGRKMENGVVKFCSL